VPGVVDPLPAGRRPRHFTYATGRCGRGQAHDRAASGRTAGEAGVPDAAGGILCGRVPILPDAADYQAALPPAERALELREKLSVLLRNDTGVLRSLTASYNGVADLYQPGPVSVVPVERGDRVLRAGRRDFRTPRPGRPGGTVPRNISLPSALSAWRLSTRNAMTLRLR